ncbi:UDP-N-acetylmuramoyl-L-alanyl-D-glutamate--2,6-diaminopimelate ligase [Gammaproteobacteria bacterium AB-CW1]|uniref:UDP-N-acetylmuramoyl-L-alanyl-D-glutamate--2,6-diaminopimelate ligase n=1 Tax=Natronospira elongata TaxID=3110268 RepID=A0AAP6JEW8_9GAMM|nr:UDP-N-acetylmuramoyl-L-alanyl-D-glutamate--2,6-diaminopimelate ligase [Gammaproteobacteria bacterium AB-CW1]
MMAAEQLQAVTLAELLSGLADPGQHAHWVPMGLSLDSRQLEPGGLFLACAGVSGRHGIDHVEEAVARGAGLVLFEPAGNRQPPSLSVPLIPVPGLSRHASLIAARYFGDPSRSLAVIGVTGTNGKSSMVQLMAATLEALQMPAASLGTLGVGRPGALAVASHTTADAVSLQAHLANLRDQGVRHVAMEVSSHGLAQHRVAAVNFRGAIFSNLSHDHLDYHGSESAYAEAKQGLFRHPGLSWAVINGDDYWADYMVSALAPGVRRLFFSQQVLAAEAGDALQYEAHPHSQGLKIVIRGSLGEAEIDSSWLGRFNAANIAAVFAALRLEGVASAPLAEALSRVPPVPGRMERFGGGRQPLLVVDYAHTPDALAKALEALREHLRGRLWCVFGCGGDRDRAKRPQMGRIAAQLADEVIVTDDNPRGEAGEQIVADILRGTGRAGRVCRDRAEAIKEAWSRARPGDIVLVAGKGHESVQIVGDQAHPFSDRELARDLAGEERS